jgi:hypothetical protein
VESHPQQLPNGEAFKEEFEESIETPHVEDDRDYNINNFKSKLLAEIQEILGHIKMHEGDKNLSSLLDATKHNETRVAHYIEREQQEQEDKKAHMIFTNSESLLKAEESKAAGTHGGRG